MVVTTCVKYDDREIAFGDPSASALFLNQSHTTFSKAMAMHPFRVERLPDGFEDRSTMTYDFLELVCASIVFAYTALEAFVNEELSDDYVYEREEKSQGGVYVVRHFDKEQIERRLSLSEKLARVLPKAKDGPSPKGTAIWEGFVHLRRLRDRIVHMKSEDRRRSQGHDKYPDSVWRDLLDPNLRNYPVDAKAIILFFKHDDEAHWLKHCPF